MKVFNASSSFQMPAELRLELLSLRAIRAFDVDAWIDAKVALVNAYFTRSRLSAAVLGMSGGIDSAVVLALLARAQKAPGSPLKKIVALALPAHKHEGVTGQGSALERAKKMARSLGLEAVELDVGFAARDLQGRLESGLGLKAQTWASGQIVPYTRTPALYGATSLLTEAGFPALVAGTTNRDEGAYLGYVGKASDGMVDLQLISDAHKSEVRAAARALGVIREILDVTPTGDMFDGRVDEEVFGAPYDAVELLLLSKTLLSEAQWEARRASWSSAAREQMDEWTRNLENLHRYNAHKYAVGSPAVHLDVWPSAVPGGWAAHEMQQAPIPEKILAAPFAPMSGQPQPLLPAISIASAEPLNRLCSTDLIQTRVLTASDAERWAALWEAQPRVPAPVDGRWSQYAEGATVGSERATCVDPQWAAALWQSLRPLLPATVHCDSEGWMAQDADGTPVWRPVGVNPVFRGIRYAETGALLAHYDAPQVIDRNHRTLMSVVIYLSDTTKTGGALRFLSDPQALAPSDRRDLSDEGGRKAIEGAEPAVQFEATPAAGSALVFEHRLLHAVAPLKPGQVKWVVRTDIIFERCGHGVLGHAAS